MHLVLVPLAVFAMCLLPAFWNEMPDSSAITSLTALIAAIAVAEAVLRDLRILQRVAPVVAVVLIAGLFYTISHLVREPDPMRNELLGNYLVNTVLGVTYGILGYLLMMRPRPILLGCCFLFLSFYVLLRTDSYSLQAMYDRLTYEGIRTNYQFTGDLCAVIALGLTVLTRRNLSVVAVVAAGLLILFIVPSRSSAIIGGAALVLAAILHRPRWLPIFLFTVIGSVLLLLSDQLLAALYPVLEGTRLESLFFGDEDTSSQKRATYLLVGWETVKEFPLLGRFGYEHDNYGPGSYVHNALSVWAAAGILPFAAFVVLLVTRVRQLITCCEESFQPTMKGLPLLFFAMLSWSLTRAFDSHLMFMSVAMFMANCDRVEAGKSMLKVSHSSRLPLTNWSRQST